MIEIQIEGAWVPKSLCGRPPTKHTYWTGYKRSEKVFCCVKTLRFRGMPLTEASAPLITKIGKIHFLYQALPLISLFQSVGPRPWHL